VDRPGLVILVEGLPGSGKSTTGQRLQRQLGAPARWVSEMVGEHPVYLFHDRASLNALGADLADGRHEEVIERAIAKWATFADATRSAGQLQILDSCLFGYLTWTLYPHFDVAPPVVHAYVDRVVELLRPLAPRLLYLQQRDVGAALQRIRPARGGRMLEGYEQRAVDSPFGKRRGLAGFEGLVAYWRAWRELADAAFERVPIAKLAVDTTDGDWAAYDRAIGAFLGLTTLEPVGRLPVAELQPLAGAYVDPSDGLTVRIAVEGGALVAYDLPGGFPRNPLLPVGDGRFEAEAWAFGVTFGEGTMAVDANEWSPGVRRLRREPS
jgi:hypothetical protein